MLWEKRSPIKYKLLLDMGERWGMKRNGNWLFID